MVYYVKLTTNIVLKGKNKLTMMKDRETKKERFIFTCINDMFLLFYLSFVICYTL